MFAANGFEVGQVVYVYTDNRFWLGPRKGRIENFLGSGLTAAVSLAPAEPGSGPGNPVPPFDPPQLQPSGLRPSGPTLVEAVLLRTGEPVPNFYEYWAFPEPGASAPPVEDEPEDLTGIDGPEELED